MSIDPAIFRVLVEQGASPEMLLAVVEAAAVADEARKEKKRAGNAERQSRYRSKRNASNALPRVTERDTPPIDNIHTPSIPQTANAVSPPFAQIVVSRWNDGPAKAGAVPSRALTKDRQAHLRARVKENGEDAVLQAIDNVAGSKFHCGENGRGWKANLGWMLKSAENFEKCMELATPAKQPSSGKQWTPEERAEYLAGLERREESKALTRPPDDAPRNRSGPRPIGQVVRITNQHDQAA